MKPTRRAVIDVGTNSIKLLIGEVSEGVVRPIDERSDQTRLGAGFYEKQWDPLESTCRHASLSIL